MARVNEASDGDDWVEIDDESELSDPIVDDGLSPIERLVGDELDGVGEMFDSESDDDD
jgi:hypothetical protein